MAGRPDRTADRKDQADQRRTADRRASVRVSSSRGRRATDAALLARADTDGAVAADTPRKRRATRDGREPLVVYLRPESIRALKIAALEHDTTVSAIVADLASQWLRARERLPRR